MDEISLAPFDKVPCTIFHHHHTVHPDPAMRMANLGDKVSMSPVDV